MLALCLALAQWCWSQAQSRLAWLVGKVLGEFCQIPGLQCSWKRWFSDACPSCLWQRILSALCSSSKIKIRCSKMCIFVQHSCDFSLHKWSFLLDCRLYRGGYCAIIFCPKKNSWNSCDVLTLNHDASEASHHVLFWRPLHFHRSSCIFLFSASKNQRFAAGLAPWRSLS